MRKLKILVKSVFIVALTAMVVVCCVSCESNAAKNVGTMEELGNTEADFQNTMTSIPTVDELNLPAELLDYTPGMMRFGLYFYDGHDFVPIRSNPSVFDETKPTMIFAHGMGLNGNLNNRDYYYNLGYNVGSFYWGVFADELNQDIARVAAKVWFYDGDMRYVGPDGNWRSGENINYSVTEIYAAFYCDLFKRFPNYSGNRIILLGHSYGAMMTFGMTSYLTTAYHCNLLSAKYLPDQIVYLDPYLTPCAATQHIRWLGDISNPIDKGGVVYLSSLAVKEARKLGISVSLVRMCDIITVPAQLHEAEKNAYNDLCDNLVHVHADAVSIHSDYGFEASPQSHIYAIIWPTYFSNPVDASAPTELSYSIINPYTQLYSRIGVNYEVDYNGTRDIYTDDTIYSSNIEKAKISGFVYLDDNKNGIMDERIGNHFAGATVTITDADGNEVLSTTTTVNGYYEAEVEQGEYTIKVTAPKGYKLASDTTTVSITYDKQLAINTWGLTK